MNEDEQLFKHMDELIFRYKGRLEPADFFRLISKYQLSTVDQIEKSNNAQQHAALCRTSMYDTLTLREYKKTTSEKKKIALVPNLVNLLCIANDSLKCIEMGCDHDKEIFDIVLSHKDKILSNEEWYIRMIPESKWLIEHMKGSNHA